MKRRIFTPFGYEYCYFPKWNWFQKVFIYFFGVVDLPTRIRFIILRRLLGTQSFNTVIDAGCANGLYSFYFARKYPASRIDGYDIEESRAREAQKVADDLGYSRLAFHCQDLSDFSEQKKADLLVCFETIQYIPDDRGLVVKFRCALHNGGILILHAPAQHGLRGNKNGDHFYDRDSLRTLLEENGFRIEKLSYTFGRYEAFLSDLYSKIVPRCAFAVLLTYPVLLFLIQFLKVFRPEGRYVVAVARAA